MTPFYHEKGQETSYTYTISSSSTISAETILGVSINASASAFGNGINVSTDVSISSYTSSTLSEQNSFTKTLNENLESGFYVFENVIKISRYNLTVYEEVREYVTVGWKTEYYTVTTGRLWWKKKKTKTRQVPIKEYQTNIYERPEMSDELYSIDTPLYTRVIKISD